MRHVNLNGLDLNLLPALDALLRHRNVTKAASEVGLSQPAMSRALARLRDLLGDPLLVRSNGGFALTLRAESISRRLSGTLDEVKDLFREPEFSPAAIRRTVRIAGTDSQSILLAPGIMRRLAREAPNVVLNIEPYGSDVQSRLENGTLDLAFALSDTPLPAGAHSYLIARDRLALVMRRGHPAAERPWTIRDYSLFEHVGVAILNDGRSSLDAILASHAVSRRVALTTPHFTAALATVATTDMVTTVSRAFAAHFAATFDLMVRDAPFNDIEFEMTLVGSMRRASDPFLIWLRGLIRDVAEETHERLLESSKEIRPDMRLPPDRA
jgi:DNA-binding transcriptional LysR family regulator